MKTTGLMLIGSLLIGSVWILQAAEPSKGKPSMEKITKTESEWRKLLTPEQYQVLREGGTECAFRGKHWDNHDKGVYHCAGCDIALFESDAKFESGTGWPSFWKPVEDKRIEEIVDRSHGMVRTEIRCARCGGHLGHVFPDGPKPTGKRYCVNSASLKFEKKIGRTCRAPLP